MIENKERLDVIVVERGILFSRERAKENIIAGNIFVDGIRTTKCGKKIDVTSSIEFVGKDIPYVSRGGLKLQKAIDAFKIDLKDKVCMDIGASTGGFTDCMLQHGACRVYSIDVGTNQLDDKLRGDSRVVSMEKTNIRYLNKDSICELADFASIDVSFISLEKVIPNLLNLLKNDGSVVALLKPQFEVGIGVVNKKGVVKKTSDHIDVILGVLNLLKSLNVKVINVDYSSIKGPNGNIEYLVYFTKSKNSYVDYVEDNVALLVSDAHTSLNCLKRE
ncbi:TlyA family RNA methyltransferase [Clostridium estertheticum]|uniref:RNA methyltransferase n=1 Tax=Clostridium estertheticum subsp. estertheticum TaxID=1552 RepID=A0A1J0GJ96_9CLOT|nr:TlyA family RNA methyltransferase [Clostridium estertheticum]APC41008.1 RNA methyltransferase [Clostridium estertheticum subsp. estertheticum]MBU3074072.1 TlyA family RNA methyltransferase [Clostridium estertheticum]MBU3164166.1 TlyA family RNA methyltransferase [Clostridium estertheticum]MBU3170102.1 TlyA family RNA methyltransferase [Clostridium estertheticum]MBZ9617121.1 TlyA family RNA methyltransferase [Clostridium estertheticum subsp. laramiense]